MQLGAVHVDDDRVDAAQRRGGQAQSHAPRRTGSRVERAALRPATPERARGHRSRRSRARRTGCRPRAARARCTCGGESVRPVRSKTMPRQLPLPEPADLDPVQRALVAFREAHQLEIEARAHGRDEPDVRILEPAKRVRERAQARCVDPLEVVDCDDAPEQSRQQPEHAEDGRARQRRDRRAHPASPRRSACSRAARWTPGSSASVASSTTAKRSVRTENASSASASDGRATSTPKPRATASSTTRRPDRRLAHPGLAREQQPARSLGDVREEAVRFGDLPLATDHCVLSSCCGSEHAAPPAAACRRFPSADPDRSGRESVGIPCSEATAKA